MPKLNIYIDGSWLFKICGAEGVLASKTESPTRPFNLSFEKLNQSLMDYIKQYDSDCTGIGNSYYATSIFELPDDFDDWPNRFDDISTESVEIIKRNVFARTKVADSALKAGYAAEAIYHPPMRGYIVKKLGAGKYQEKQVDTTVVALLVRGAVTNPKDYHVVIAGDADILPAIKVAYPEYSGNVFIATSHPDELNADHRHTAFSLHNFEFNIEPYYLQDHVVDIIEGDHAYHCANCHVVFTRVNPVPSRSRPYCHSCLAKRQ